MVPARFRCPFEIKGERDGKIIHIHLGDDQNTRLELIKAAFQKFHSDHSMVSIKFHLQAKLLELCTSLEELKIYILPYQAEIIATELDFRLSPFFTYQHKGMTKDEVKVYFNKNPHGFMAAHFMTKTMEVFGMSPSSIIETSLWIGAMILREYHQGVASPTFYIGDGKGDQGMNYIAISSGGVTIYHEDFPEVVGEGNDRRNCFSIVTCPFYPEPFGRYSEDVTVVMSRMKDFTALDPVDRRKIRAKCNEAYASHGVEIKDPEPEEDKQPDGLWIP